MDEYKVGTTLIINAEFMTGSNQKLEVKIEGGRLQWIYYYQL
ncbi:MAG: hypothetical protein PHQ35_11605 [Phycisphaerae bacterium]|nr:hypothetical protein [Phycisphaerae bacterium]